MLKKKLQRSSAPFNIENLKRKIRKKVGKNKLKLKAQTESPKTYQAIEACYHKALNLRDFTLMRQKKEACQRWLHEKTESRDFTTAEYMQVVKKVMSLASMSFVQA